MVVEPGLQREVVGVAAQTGHRHVGVGVHEAGHQDLALAVDHAVEAAFDRAKAEIGNLAVFHSHASVFDRLAVAVTREDIDVFYE